MAVSAPERQYLLNQLGRLADADLNRLWERAIYLTAPPRSLGLRRPPSISFGAIIEEGFPEVVDPYYQTAADLAATWFEESLPGSPYIAQPADPLPVDRLVLSARWALRGDGAAGLSRLQGTLQRAVFDGARQTTLLNVTATESKWARYASANACAFCRLLATRGADYRSERTAATDVHDHCSCLPVEDRDNTYQPPEYIEQWQGEYAAARDAAGSGDPTQILAAWRQLGAR